MTDVLHLGVREALAQMRAGNLSPVELVSATLDAAERTGQDLGCFESIDHAGSHAAAREAEARYQAGEPRPLEGIPVPVKDIEDTAGLRTTYGSLLYQDFVPEHDGGAAASLRAAGAVIVAKTTTSSFGHLDDTVRLSGPTTRHPDDPARSAGGSSGGAAAAVAAGVCRIAHGSDGAGSVRLPATLCGVCGFKPTYGRIPRWPVNDPWAARSHHGVIGRTVDDMAVAMTGFAREDHRDPLTCWDAPDWLAVHRHDLTGVRIGFATTLGFGPLDSEVEKVVREAVAALAGTGLRIDELDIRLADQSRLFDRIYAPNLAWDLRLVRDRTDALEGSLTSMIRYGENLTLQEYMSARAARATLLQEVLAAIDGYDFLLTPSAPYLAWPAGDEPAANGQPLGPSVSERLGSLYVFNLLGWPAVSVPCGRASAPSGWVGLQVVGRRGHDLDCLAVASHLEHSLGTVRTTGS